ncbi:hypothetical protein GMOD_00008486 [Pyrenophora seminiperda CCB06]|uniref:Zinc finger PHD-type domain-containing protein n=1 Tax=Pyrenophora seminiperda CCB06 TaxID=1302712 RepID=A0A3M7M8K2_9PLEO|nr:hypothetical protein GMOD_00008486 [Pyrenophora seminiperda CCB06]
MSTLYNMNSRDELVSTNVMLHHSMLPCDGMYTCQVDLGSTHLKFPLIGHESSESLRKRLQNWAIQLPEHDVKPDLLLQWQGLLWRDPSGPAVKCNPSGLPVATQEHRWRDRQYVAEHVDYIETALRGTIPRRLYGISLNLTVNKRIFVVHDDSKVCSNQACAEAHRDDPQHNKRTTIITLEPFLDWGTITATQDLHIASGIILTFRRNGALMDDPLWTQYVGKLVPKGLQGYCIECLEELWARRRDAWEIIGDLQFPVEHEYLLEQLMQLMQHTRPEAELFELGESVNPDTCDQRPNISLGPLELDGGSPTNYLVKGKEPLRTQHLSETAISSLSNHRTPEHSAQPTEYTTVRNLICPPRPPLIHHQSPIKRPNDHDKIAQDTQEEKYEKLGSASLLDNTVPYFGSGHCGNVRDIDTNAVCRFFLQRARKRREKLARKKEAAINGYFTSVDGPGSVAPEGMARSSIESRLSEPSSFPLNLSDHDVYPLVAYTGKGKGKALPVNGASTGPPTKSSKKPQPPFEPVFPRVDPVTQVVPPGVSEREHAAFLARIPDKDNLICICGKPARTYDVRIAQCITPDCPIGWLHYDCMDTKFKLCFRHGTQKCDICRNEEDFAEMNQQGNWSGETAIDSSQEPISLGEAAVAAALPNIGGFKATSNPYGLASSGPVGGGKTTKLSPTAPCFNPVSNPSEESGPNHAAAVGSAIPMGLAPSLPFVLTNAYMNPQEFSHQADDRWARAFRNHPLRAQEATGIASIAAEVATTGYAYADDEWDDEMDMRIDEGGYEEAG